MLIIALGYNGGMLYLILTCLMLVIAITVHGMSAWLQRRYKIYDHLGPLAWSTHQFVIAPAWILFFMMTTQIGRFANWPLPVPLPEIGWLTLIVAVLLMISSLSVMDIQVLTNGWLFDNGPRHPRRQGIYLYLANPFYDGLALAYVAVALINNNAAFIAIAGILHLLLNHIQARLENIADSLIK